MTASRPKTTTLPPPLVCRGVAAGAARSAETMVAATAVTATTTRLRIDPPRRAPQQQHEDGVDDDEEHADGDLPRRRRVAHRGRGEAQDVAHHLQARHLRGEDAERRGAGNDEEDNGQRRHSHRAGGDERPRAMRGAFSRSHREVADRDRPPVDLEPEGIEHGAALRALAQVRPVPLGVLEVTLTGLVHSGSTNSPSASLSRFRARKSLFFTVPRGSFFIEAISSYDSSAKWRSWMSSR